MDSENRKIIKGIFDKSLQERVKIDIRLHNFVIKEYEFVIKEYEKDIRYYLDANAEKIILLDILNGKITDLKQIRKTIKNLKSDRRTHLYCKKDKRWDKIWVRVYDEWIKHLNGLLGQKKK